MTVSVCFPWRSNGAHSERVADWIERRWALLFPTFELIRGSSKPGAFNRSQSINDACSRSTGDILIVADLDVIFDQRMIQQAVDRVSADHSAWGFGFSCYAKLTVECTEALLNLPSDIRPENMTIYEESETTMSGLVIISKEAFDSFHGFDEAFVGWGYEDLAFAQQADRISSHFRIDGYAYHMWHAMRFDEERAAINLNHYREKYLGLFLPEPTALPDGDIDVPYPTTQMSVRNRVEPCVWTATGLPPGLTMETSGVIHGTPQRWSVTAVIVTVTDAEGVAVIRPYFDVTIHPKTLKKVGLYSSWDEPFEDILTRLRWATPGLNGTAYKSFRFVKPDEPHDYALIFNATERSIPCSISNIYVLIFEPPEILGEDNPWLTKAHPQAAGNIFMFGGGSAHQQVLGLHIPQATLSDPTCLPSTKPLRCSMICSDKTVTPWHRKRREIMEALLNTDLDINFYGRGMGTGSDPRARGEICSKIKDEALRPYVFTIDFENSARNVLTDKFSDPLLNGTVPITNSMGAGKAFPSDSFEFVDFEESTSRIVERIREIITQPSVKRYDDPVREAKEWLSAGRRNICEWLYRKIEH